MNLHLRSATPMTRACLLCKHETGFSLVSAIFLLIVLAALGAAMVRISSSQHTGSALDVQGARAYQAARAGIEWGLYHQLASGGNHVCDNTPTSFVPPAPTLSSFTVTVVCQNFAPAGLTVSTRLIQATACNQPAAGKCPGNSGGTYYVERQLQVKL